MDVLVWTWLTMLAAGWIWLKLEIVMREVRRRKFWINFYKRYTESYIKKHGRGPKQGLKIRCVSDDVQVEAVFAKIKHHGCRCGNHRKHKHNNQRHGG